jgi:hypothetical protein
MTFAESMFRSVMCAYPPAFRRAFGRELVLVFRDQERNGLITRGYWVALIIEIVSTAPQLWAEELHDGFLITELTMKLMAILAILIGMLETLNSLSESREALFAHRDPVSRAVLILTIASALLLTLAGLALLVRGEAARTIGRIAAVGCLIAFVFMASARPMMSVGARLVGIAFPISLLVFLFVRRPDPHREIA